MGAGEAETRQDKDRGKGKAKEVTKHAKFADDDGCSEDSDEDSRAVEVRDHTLIRQCPTMSEQPANNAVR